MFVVTAYCLEKKLDGSYQVLSKEEHICPKCGNVMSSKGRRPRVVKDGIGGQAILYVRRMRCKVCHTMQLELPDVIYPYKHYRRTIIHHTVTSEKEIYWEPDLSTMNRWKKIF